MADVLLSPRAVAEALGLDPKAVQKIILTCDGMTPVRVEVTHIIKADDNRFTTLISKYELRERANG